VTLNEEDVRRRSPLRRVVARFHLWLIRAIYRPAGRRRVSPVTVQRHFLQAMTRITPVGCRQHPRRWQQVRVQSNSPTLHPRAVTGAPRRPKCPLPESPCLAPSSRHLLPDLPVVPRWLLTSYIGVRAESSGRVRSRPGRLRFSCSTSTWLTSPFVAWAYSHD